MKLHNVHYPKWSHGLNRQRLCPGDVDTPLARSQLADLALDRGEPLERMLEEVISPLGLAPLQPSRARSAAAREAWRSSRSPAQANRTRPTSPELPKTARISSWKSRYFSPS